MPNGKHTVDLDLPINKIWSFVSDINNWAPLVPGYIEHKIINENQSTWKFVSDIGIMKKTLHMKINITNWQEPTKVMFDLKGVNEKFSGNGYFEAESVDEGKTKITGYLNINAEGMLGSVINPVLKSVIPRTATDLTEAIANDLNKIS